MAQHNPSTPAELDQRVRELSAHIHSATAELTSLISTFDSTGYWNDGTLRSFPHWLSIASGFSIHSGKELLRIGQALEQLPIISSAFRSGELSFDKVRLVIGVATPSDEVQWATIAKELSTGQLTRICRQYRLALAAEEPGRAETQMAARGVWAYYQDDGMLHLLAKLPPEDGALVLSILESVAGSRLPLQGDAQVKDPAQDFGDRWAARQADALVSVFEHAQKGVQAVGGSRDGEAVELDAPLCRTQVVVHVDEAVLSGGREGRCELEQPIPIDSDTARRLACNAELVTVIERNGSPLDVGRAQRRVSGRLRRALESRDKHCRFPGCSVPASRSEGHHLDEWSRGGATDLSRLMLMCKFHHLRYHQGAFQILQEGNKLSFVTSDGQQIVASKPRRIDGSGVDKLYEQHEAEGMKINELTPTARSAGEQVDLNYVTDVLLMEKFRPKDAPGPPDSMYHPSLPSHLPDVGATLDEECLPWEDGEPYDFEHSPVEVDERDREIVGMIEERGSVNADLVIARLKIKASECLMRLSKLELAGLIKRPEFGMGYVGANPP